MTKTWTDQQRSQPLALRLRSGSTGEKILEGATGWKPRIRTLPTRRERSIIRRNARSWVVDSYGRWFPMGNKAAVDRLDDRSGSKVVASGVRAEDFQTSGRWKFAEIRW